MPDPHRNTVMPMTGGAAAPHRHHTPHVIRKRRARTGPRAPTVARAANEESRDVRRRVVDDLLVGGLASPELYGVCLGD